MNTPALRTALAVLAALPLTLLTACGDSDTRGGDDPATRSTRSTAPSGPLSARELEKRSLNTRDLEGFLVDSAGKGQKFTAQQVGTDRKQCRPLALALTPVALGTPVATAQRWAAADLRAPSPGARTGGLDGTEPALDLPMMAITLASYEDAGAARGELTALNRALTACHEGFTGTQRGTDLPITAVTRDRAPGVGEEALAFTATVETEGAEGPEKVVVFRTGGTLAYLTAVDPLGRDFDLPATVLKAQAAKLR
jgi:hypothetical protein